MSEGINNGGTNAKSGKGAGARHEGDLFNVVPVSMMLVESVMDVF